MRDVIACDEGLCVAVATAEYTVISLAVGMLGTGVLYVESASGM